VERRCREGGGKEQGGEQGEQGEQGEEKFSDKRCGLATSGVQVIFGDVLKKIPLFEMLLNPKP